MTGKNWTGQTFSLLTFIRKTDQKRDDKYLWELQCECGNTILSIPFPVTSGHRKSCGCHTPDRSSTIKDRTGQRYGKLTFIRQVDKKGSGGDIMWECQCDYGETTIVVPNNVFHGTKSCGCQNIENGRKLGHSTRQYEPMISSARTVWYRYNDGDLYFEEFFDLTQQNCYWCGIEPYRICNASNAGKRSVYQQENGDFIYNGLDRLDNTKPHNKDNVVPCCWPCNEMHTHYSVDEWLDKVEKIYLHTILPKQKLTSGK